MTLKIHTHFLLEEKKIACLMSEKNIEVLIKQLSNDDEKAFEQLFEIYFVKMHNIAYNRLQSREAADDIVQDIFTDLWTNRKSLNIHTSVDSYLFRAVKNRVYKHIRHKSVRQKEEYISRIHKQYYNSNPYPNSSNIIEATELKEHITSYLNELPEKTQTIFRLSREEHYTYQEIADKLDCSPKTIEYHISKALQHLKLQLNNYDAVLIPFLFFLLS